MTLLGAKTLYCLEVDLAVFASRALGLSGVRRKVWGRSGCAELVVAEAVAGYSDGILLHLAALAELRVLLGAPPEEWRVLQGPEVDLSGKVPDAVWEGSRGPRAVEVDLGYALPRVRVKVRHYARSFAGQVWGVTSPRRASWLHLEALLVKVPIEVRLLDLPLEPC